jgi:hypothetical protein
MATPERRGTNPFDPADERSSDPVPQNDDLLARANPRRGHTPRRYDEEPRRDEAVMPSTDSTLKTRI